MLEINDKQTANTITDPAQISSMLDKAFDQGVDRCIEFLKINRMRFPEGGVLYNHNSALIGSIEQLKNKS